MHAYTWEDPEICQIETQNQAKWNDCQRKPGKMPHICDSNYHEGMTSSLRLPVCPHLPFFPPNKNFSCSTTFLTLWEFISAKSRGQGLSLTSGLVASNQHSDCHGPTSVFSWKLKSCFKPLQAEAHWDQLNMYFVILFRRKLASLLLKTIFTWVIQPPLKTYQQQ